LNPEMQRKIARAQQQLQTSLNSLLVEWLIR
jgi:hypothetical protein